MALANRIEGDCRIAGDLHVDGDMPATPRSRMVQDPQAVFAIPLTSMRVHDAMDTLLPATSATDDIGIVAGTLGTNAPRLTTGDVKTATVTRYARFQCVVPAEYDAAETLTLRISAGMETTVSDGTATVDVQAYKTDREGGVGADICATGEQSINDLTFANKDFTITPTGLSAGDVLDVRIALAVSDTSTGTAVIATIGAVELLADIKG